MQLKVVNFSGQVLSRAFVLLFVAAAYTTLQAPATLRSASLAASDELSAGFVSPEASAYRGITSAQMFRILSDRSDLASSEETQKLSETILSLCREYNLDATFVLAMIQAESGFHVHAVSEAGAVGLMQVMPATATVVLKSETQTPVTKAALLNPFLNVRVGIAYLAYLRDRYQGFSPYYLLAAYNLGPAKLDELRLKKSFKPVKTKRYFETVWRGMFQFRQEIEQS